jgi:hypothetical protein
MVNQTDEISSQAKPLPSFIKFNPLTMSLSVETTDASNSGTYFLLYDYFLSLFSSDMAMKHTK